MPKLVKRDPEVRDGEVVEVPLTALQHQAIVATNQEAQDAQKRLMTMVDILSAGHAGPSNWSTENRDGKFFLILKAVPK